MQMQASSSPIPRKRVWPFELLTDYRLFPSPEPPFLLVTWSAKLVNDILRRVALGTRMITERLRGARFWPPGFRAAIFFSWFSFTSRSKRGTTLRARSFGINPE